MADAWLRAARAEGGLRIEGGGAWTIEALARLDEARAQLARAAGGGGDVAIIALHRLEAFDTTGAWLLTRLEQDLERQGIGVRVEGLRAEHAALLAEIRRVDARPPPPRPRPPPLLRIVAELGQGAIEAADEGRQLLSFFGQIMITLGRVLVRPGRLRIISLTHHLEHAGVDALPIVGLISFLIGIVLAYQGADQLRYFGAEIFTIDLLAISVTREIGILLTAIVVAGRSGSAFAAQIGTMQVNEEVDALRVLGLDPVEVLVLPRLLALVIALPLLAFFADMMALLGGGLMCVFALGIPPGQFIDRLEYALLPSYFWVGIAKAPVFAFLIGMAGCYEGMNVRGSAESVGQQTTRAVVVSIFLVIVFDALFSILFSYLGL
jgi:phospholipid/cholesterol/gamma-HCH transport system permease protein